MDKRGTEEVDDNAREKGGDLHQVDRDDSHPKDGYKARFVNRENARRAVTQEGMNKGIAIRGGEEKGNQNEQR